MPSPTQDEEIESLVNMFIEKWLPDHYAHLVDTDDNDGQYLRAALHRLMLKERREEAELFHKHATSRYYGNWSSSEQGLMESHRLFAVERYDELNSQIEGSKSDE